MADKKQKKGQPTAADRAAAKFIKARLDKLPRDERPTQDELVAAWGDGGSQSLMSQYINGSIRHNLRSVTFFARMLKCDPREIYPDLPGLKDYLAAAPRTVDEVRDAPLISNPFDDEDLAILRKLLSLPDEMRDAITDVIENAYAMAKQKGGKARRSKERQTLEVE